MRKEIDYAYFSKPQIKAAQLMATSEKKQTNKQIAKTVGVDERTIYRWKNDSKFMDMYFDLCNRDSDEFMGIANKQLQKSVLKGSVKALELYYKTKGMLVDRKEVTKDIDMQITTIDGKTNEQLRKEAIEMEKKLLGQFVEAEVIDDE